MSGANTDQRLPLWQILLGLVLLTLAAKFSQIPWLARPADSLIFPFADWINQFFNYLKDDLGLIVFSRAFAGGVESLLDVSANLLYGRARWPRLGPIPWTVITVTAFMIGYALRGWSLGLLAGGTFVWIALLGQWKLAMETLSVILIAAPFTVLLGLLLGIAAWSQRRIEMLLNPLLNLAQSMPHFAYMIPVVIFIGIGPKAGAIVTIIFATPPMVRMTLLGLKKVPSEIIESGAMCGATNLQLLTRVRIPSARASLLIGVNQVIMQCLAMVVLASFIGMPGLGQKLLQLLQSLKIGRSMEIGITIVLIAVVLDRCSKAWAQKQPIHYPKDTHWLTRHKNFVIWLVLVCICFCVAYFEPLAQTIKRTQAFSVAKPLDAWVGDAILMLDPYAQSLRAFLIIKVLTPMRDAYLWLPFVAVLAGVAALSWRIGGLRSLITCLILSSFLALSGWWDRSMITAYMVSFSVIIAILIGLPVAVLAATGQRSAKLMLLACDTAQTFPSFIYLIPVIMLFGVNDVAAIGAVVIFATVPIVRYTIEGLRDIPPTLIEAAQMSGANRLQILWNVRFPMALPTMVVGINQSIMFSLFMVIIAAFIGTQDLGQEMQRALSSSDVGKGLVLGCCVAFMGLSVDHLVTRWANERRMALGL